MERDKKFIDVVPPADPTKTKINCLSIEVYYSKGGLNVWNGKQEPRGFSISVTPCEKRDGMVMASVTQGLRLFLLEAARYSPKAHGKAREMAQAKETELVSAVCLRNGLTTLV